jgi:putative heme-binding domain-containing protein
MIRPFLSETKRYGEYSKPGEFVYDHPFQWGSRRIGPDLAREGGKQSNLWHVLHFANPPQVTPGTLMPRYTWLLTQKLDFESIPVRVHAMQRLGVPYTNDDRAHAADNAMAQAAAIADSIVKQGGPKGLEDKDVAALIAYVQRLGTDLFATPAAPTVPAIPATTAERLAGPVVGTMKYDDVVAAVLADTGDAALGAALFRKQGCNACHTTSVQEPLKAPCLVNVAERLKEADIIESILKPSAKIAAGFTPYYFKMKSGDVVQAFLVGEDPTTEQIRELTGVVSTLQKSAVAKRGVLAKSFMPENIADNLTPHDVASIIAYLQTLKTGAPLQQAINSAGEK